MRSKRPILSRLSPPRVAHAWWDGDQAAGASGAPAAADADEPADPPPSGEQADGGLSLEEARKLRRESQALRRRLTELESAAKQADEAKLSELERANKRAQELEAALAERDTRERRARLEAAAAVASSRLGFADPDDALRFLDESAVEWDDDGRPSNVSRLLTDVLKVKPYLRATHLQPPDLGQGNRGRSTLTLEQIRRMKPDEINRRWDEVQEVMAASGSSR